jgi:hypothetical protein
VTTAPQDAADPGAARDLSAGPDTGTDSLTGTASPPGAAAAPTRGAAASGATGAKSAAAEASAALTDQAWDSVQVVACSFLLRLRLRQHFLLTPDEHRLFIVWLFYDTEETGGVGRRKRIAAGVKWVAVCACT